MSGEQPPADYYIRSMIQPHLGSPPFLENRTQVRKLNLISTYKYTPLQTDQSSCVQ